MKRRSKENVAIWHSLEGCECVNVVNGVKVPVCTAKWVRCNRRLARIHRQLAEIGEPLKSLEDKKSQ
jgi:hypothetical protein